ncbi:hypothetical protein BCL93_102390 [Onishia taeanensis]|uniref:Uncharacterized protein n=1 Tax=Onishia taeanensis TaxID=284577 RepID=A0A328Y388_9GAMM|nr:hypothetical protein [Halomonas taeanensis]RAR63647.1 hypothetical protein BCL93_102390 [Halomonas taeanensis]
MNEPQRLQYLEAMGLTAWVGRYRLPNAAPTEVCAWEEPAAPAAKAPAARLQALIDDVAAPARPASAPGTGASTRADQRPAEPHPGQRDGKGAERGDEAPASKGVGRARALLTGETPTAQSAPAKASPSDQESAGDKRSSHDHLSQAAPSQQGVSQHSPSQQSPSQQGRSHQTKADAAAASADETSTSAPAEALRFSLQIAALEGRWLLVLPAEAPPGEMQRRLLANLLHAAGIRPAEMPAFQHFRWPMMDELPVSAPLEEARDGLRAFLDGRRRQGWRPERLLVFGEDATLSRVLALEGGDCTLLELPAWQGPSLEALATDAEAKRALWPLLRQWGEAWHTATLQQGSEQEETVQNQVGQGDMRDQNQKSGDEEAGAP